MVHPANSEHPSHTFGIFPELNTQCREINRHCHKNHIFGLLIWIAFLGACGFMFGIQTLYLARQYLRYDIRQTITEVGVNHMMYPDLFICSLNALNNTKMQEEGFDNETIRFFLSKFEQSYIQLNETEQMYGENQYQRWLGTKKAKGITNMEQTLLYFALKPWELIHYCQYGGELSACFPYDEKITEFVSRAGLCFVMELKRQQDNGSWTIAKQKAPGYTGAVTVAIGSLEEDKRDKFHVLDNYILYLGTSKSIDKYHGTVPLDGIYLAKGTFTLVTIREKRVTRLDYPYSECYSDAEMKTYAKSNYSVINQVYNNKLCHRECEAIYAMNKCNKTCILPGQFNGAPHTFRICTTGIEFDCIEKQLRKAMCHHCSQPCRYITWTYTYNNIRTTLTPDALIFISHSDMNYLTSDETPSDSIESVLGAVGGQLSLWLGFKVATIAQMIYYTWVWGLAKCCGAKSGVVTMDQVVVGKENHVMPD